MARYWAGLGRGGEVGFDVRNQFRDEDRLVLTVAVEVSPLMSCSFG